VRKLKYMVPFILACIPIVLNSPFAKATNNIEIVVVESNGIGESQEEAVEQALLAAVGKVNGVSIKADVRTITAQEAVHNESNFSAVTSGVAQVDTVSVGAMATREYKAGEQPPESKIAEGALVTSSIASGVAITNTATDFDSVTSYDASSKDISTKTAGQVKSYEVLKSVKDADGYSVLLSVSIAKYKASIESKRTRVAVVPFRIKKPGGTSKAFERAFSQNLISQLTQSNKFAVLDRDYLNEQGVELGRLQAGEVSVDELAKLGNKLGTDFILVGTVNDVVSRKRTQIMKSTGKEIAMVDQGVRLSYRLIEAASGLVKISDGYDNVETKQGLPSGIESMAGSAGRVVASNILLNFFPVMVEAMQGGYLILGQGGKTLKKGQAFTLVQYGEELFDSYTRESLGRIEKNVGVVEIVEVYSKQSRARVVKSIVNLDNEFVARSYIVKPISENKNKVNKAKQIKELKAKSAERIKSLKKSSDDDW
jgi:TolB-like protein